MLRKVGFLFGFLFLLGGILGFVPEVTEHEMFVGIFKMNMMDGIMHLASGVMFVLTSLAGARGVRLWFQLFGTFYAAMSVMGFIVGDGMIFRLISNNLYDSWWHAALALVLLLIGFGIPKGTASREVNGK